MKYRKKPVVIEALHFDGNIDEALEFLEENGRFQGRELYISTLEGLMHVSPGDFIIQGVSGEFYPCKPDIFEKTYEAVDSANDEFNQGFNNSPMRNHD